ncbi:CTD small phosphatase-like protein 2 [Coemansia sp. RSA 1358]|nr:CTD small phosphatase-like protein 2 [Coemansia sp. RSA 1358]
MSSPKRKPRDALARIASPRNRLVAAGDFGSKRRGDETDDSLSQAATLRPPVNKRIRTSANPGVQQLAKKTTNNGNIPNTPSSDDSEHGSSRGSSKLGRANGDISEDSRRGAGSPPSPLKSILSPMLDLLRRVSGIAQDPLGLQKQDSISSADSETSASDRAIDDDDGLRTIKKGSSENIHPMPSSSESQDENCPVDSAGAPVGSPEANSLTAPPMNPTTLGTATSSITSYVGGGFHANGMQLYLPESNEFVGADSCSASPITAGYPETPCKENIPVYTEHDVIVGLDTQESGVAMLSAATALSNTEALNQQQQPQPGQDQSNLLLAVNELRAADSDLDLSQISSLADSEIDAQYEQYLQYEDEEDEFNPYLFMADLPPIPKEHTLRPYALPRKTRSSPPITLVLDLDETLVHCALTKVENPDLEFAVEYNGVDYKVYCRLRPGYREFLEKASELFEVVVFTASQQVYADKLLNLIDPDRRFIRHRLFRDSCVYVNTNYVKDLGILGRDETKMVLVDNCPQAFAYQQSNGIPIESWYEDKNDRELMRLMDFLETLVGEEDVRPKVDAHFKTREKVIEAKKRYQLKISSITYGSSLYSSVRNTNN